MARDGDKATRAVEKQIEGLRRRLAEGENHGGSAGFLTGLTLGVATGAALALAFAPRAGEETRERLRDLGDAILPRGRDDDRAGAESEPGDAADTGPITLVPNADTSEARAPATPTRPAPRVGPNAPVAALGADTAPEEISGGVDPEGSRCPATHPIKGNKSSSGEWIYHLPDTRFYAGTIPERCFATEADAQSAGYRQAKG